MWHVLNNWSILGPLFDFYGHSFWNTSHIPVYPDHVHHIGCISIQAGCSFWFVWIFSKDSRKGTGCGLFSEVLRKPSDISSNFCYFHSQSVEMYLMYHSKNITLWNNFWRKHETCLKKVKMVGKKVQVSRSSIHDISGLPVLHMNIFPKTTHIVSIHVLKSKPVNEINAFCHNKNKKRWMDGFQVHPSLITTLYKSPKVGLFPLQMAFPWLK